jgi:opacity protein-like surface antigen
MKKLLKRLAIIAGLATASAGAVAAQDFDRNITAITLNSGDLSFGIEGEKNKLSRIETEFRAYTFKFNDRVTTDLVLGAAYNRTIDSVEIGVKANTNYTINENWDLYGNAGLKYVAATVDTSRGEWVVTPTLGTQYLFGGHDVKAFAEVSYDWVASQDWQRAGGTAEVGVEFGIANNVALRPSLVRTFDTKADATNLRAEIVLNF